MKEIIGKERADNTIETPVKILKLLMLPYEHFSEEYGSKDKTLLDCACGNAPQRDIVESHFGSVTFVDKDIPSELDNFVQFDLEKLPLPFADRSFDVVFSFETIEHLSENNQIGFVKELLRVGKIVVIGSVSVDGPNYVDNDVIYKKSLRLNPYHTKEFASWEWREFFSNFSDPVFYHSVIDNDVFEIREGLDGKHGYANYVVLRGG